MATAALSTTGCGDVLEQRTTLDGPDPERLLVELSDRLSPDNRYRDPDAEERSTARRAARSLIADHGSANERDALFGDLGFVVHRGIDPATGRPFDLYLATGSDDRSWGAVSVDRSGIPGVVIEVPHPRFDINTEKLGLALHRRVPGSVLLVAGAHRHAADGDADVTHNNRSLFHVLAVELGRSGLYQIQLHGFADRNLPDSDAVVSTGSAPASDGAYRIAAAISDIGLLTCRAWAGRCGQLEGKTNEQGRSTAKFDGVFIHLELSWSVRSDEETWRRVIAVLADRLSIV